MDQNTNITVKGPVSFQPLSADLALNVKDLAIRPFQPILAMPCNWTSREVQYQRTENFP